MPTYIVCFRNVTNLRTELARELAKYEKPEDISFWEKDYTCRIIEKPRKCKSWYPWTEYLTPKEHFEEYKMEQLEYNRRKFEAMLAKDNKEFLGGLEHERREWQKDAGKWPFRLIVAAIILAVAEVVSNVPVIQRFLGLD